MAHLEIAWFLVRHLKFMSFPHQQVFWTIRCREWRSYSYTRRERPALCASHNHSWKGRNEDPCWSQFRHSCMVLPEPVWRWCFKPWSFARWCCKYLLSRSQYVHLLSFLPSHQIPAMILRFEMITFKILNCLGGNAVGDAEVPNQVRLLFYVAETPGGLLHDQNRSQGVDRDISIDDVNGENLAAIQKCFKVFFPITCWVSQVILFINKIALYVLTSTMEPLCVCVCAFSRYWYIPAVWSLWLPLGWN